MRFRSHQSWFPKDEEFPGEYEDASARSEKHGRAIVADGVSSAIFSRAWARLLTRSALAEPPDFLSEDAIQAWLTPLQQKWSQGINFAGLPWHQKPKATSIGAQTTLLAVAVEPLADGGDPAGEYRLQASGIGDCVLFLVRDGRKVFSFPLTSAAEFTEPPHIFSSIAKGVAYVDKFRHLDGRCHAGDLLVVCSDAIGLWAMGKYEAGREVDWMRYWENDEAWQEDIQSLRVKRAAEDGHRMRVDDCTLLLLQVIAEESLADEPDVQPDRSDEPFVLLGAVRQNEASSEDAADTLTAAIGSLQVATGEIASDCGESAAGTPNEAVADLSTGLAIGTGDPPPEDFTPALNTPPAIPDDPGVASEPRQANPPPHQGLLNRLRRRLRGE